MNDQQLAEWLNERWTAITNEPSSGDDPEIDRLVNSSLTSIRYAFFTQLLGKFALPSRDLLCLQMGTSAPESGDAGRWDPRSFCTRIVVPWVQANQNVLGTSTDPYVNNPLRRPRLDQDMDRLRNRDEWVALVEFLSSIDSVPATSAMLDRCLRSISRRLSAQKVAYPVPLRISLEQLCALLDQYLMSLSGGLRPQIVATALFRTVGEAFAIFPKVTSQGVNEPDAASGSPGDVLCYGTDDSLALAVEVKGNNLTLVELESTIVKARSSGVANILFATPDFAQEDRETIASRINEEWMRGSNIYQTSIQTLTRSLFVLLDEKWRVTFLHDICRELDSRSTQPADRTEWAALLASS